MSARVIVLAGPSGSGKTRLSKRLGLPVLSLDDFYRSGDDPALPRLPTGMVDWDDPASWDAEAAMAAIESLCRDGVAEVPVYDLAHDARTGTRRLHLGDTPYFLAEGVFAHEVVGPCRERGLLESAYCVRHHRAVTFWRRLARDLHERRKPPAVLLRRGWRLMRAQPRVVARAVARGCTPATPRQAYEQISRTVGRSRA